MPADVRAEEDERALVLRVRGVDALQAAEDLFLALFFGLYLCECRVVLEWGPREGRVLDLVVHFPAFALEGGGKRYEKDEILGLGGGGTAEEGRTVVEYGCGDRAAVIAPFVRACMSSFPIWYSDASKQSGMCQVRAVHERPKAAV